MILYLKPTYVSVVTQAKKGIGATLFPWKSEQNRCNIVIKSEQKSELIEKKARIPFMPPFKGK